MGSKGRFRTLVKLERAKHLLLLATLILICGCMNTTTAPENIDAKTKALRPPEGLALIYVVRPWAFRAGAGSVPFKYNGHDVGYIGTDQYLAFYAPPQQVDFGLAGDEDSLSINIEAGQTYFIKMEYSMRLNPLAPPTFTLLDASTGRMVVDKYSLSGSNPFSYVCGFGDLAIIKDLYSYNLDHSSKEDLFVQSSSCMVIAAAKGQMEVVRWGHEVANLPINNFVFGIPESPVPSTPLKAALDAYNLDIAEYLIDNGALMHAIGKNFQFLAINRAVELQSLDLVVFLLTKGANSNSYLNGETPLVKAIKTNQIEIAKYLLANGAHVSYYESTIEDPLTVARQLNKPDFEQLLLASGAVDRQEIARRQEEYRNANNQKTVEQVANIATALLGIALGVAAVHYANDIAPAYYPAPSVKHSTPAYQRISSPKLATPTYQPISSPNPSAATPTIHRTIGASDDRKGGYETTFGNRYEYDLSKPSDRIRYEVDPAAQLRDRLDTNPVREIEQSLGQHGGGVLKD